MLSGIRSAIFCHRAVAIALIIICLSSLASCRRSASGPSNAAQTTPVVDAVRPIQMEIVEWDRFTGRLEPIQYVEVRSTVSGYLQAIHFAEGDLVEEGDILFTVDPRPLEAELQTSIAREEEARALLSQAKTNIAQSTAEKEQVDASVSLARIRLRRAEDLSKQNAISDEEVDVRENDLAASIANQRAAEAVILAAEAGVASAEAALSRAQAERQSAELNLSYASIEAPISGRTSDWRANVGNYISGGGQNATLLTTIVSIAPIHVVFDASEQQLLEYERRTAISKTSDSNTAADFASSDYRFPVYLALADEDGFPHRGHIDFVDNRVDPDSGTIRARAIFGNSTRQLLPGLFAKIRVPGSVPFTANLIPDTAILSDQAMQYVYVVHDDGVVQRRTISIGGMSHGLRIIREGVTGDSLVITSGLQLLREGMQVKAEISALEIDQPAAEELPDTIEMVPREEWITGEPVRTGIPSSSASNEPLRDEIDRAPASATGLEPSL